VICFAVVMPSFVMRWQGIALDGLAWVLRSMVTPCSGKALLRLAKA